MLLVASVWFELSVGLLFSPDKASDLQAFYFIFYFCFGYASSTCSYVFDKDKEVCTTVIIDNNSNIKVTS